MKEQQIKFNRNDSIEIVKIEPDKKKEAIKEAQDLCLAANELFNRLKEGKLEEGYCGTLLSLFESYTVKIHSIFDFKSVMKKEHDERYQDIRNLNAQNRELRKQLGDKVSAEDVREKLKNYASIINEWWKKEGFGYVPSVTFHPYVCQVKISGSMSMHFDKAQPDFLRNKGYEVSESERNCYELAISDKNIALLEQEIVKRFPSAKISKMEVCYWQTNHIRDIEFSIKDYSDI